MWSTVYPVWSAAYPVWSAAYPVRIAVHPVYCLVECVHHLIWILYLAIVFSFGLAHLAFHQSYIRQYFCLILVIL